MQSLILGRYMLPSTTEERTMKLTTNPTIIPKEKLRSLADQVFALQRQIDDLNAVKSEISAHQG